MMSKYPTFDRLLCQGLDLLHCVKQMWSHARDWIWSDIVLQPKPQDLIVDLLGLNVIRIHSLSSSGSENITEFVSYHRFKFFISLIFSVLECE